MASLPHDLITEILIRSPVKDLLRFRCVSKHINSLFDSREIEKAHLSHSLRTPTRRLIIFKHCSSVMLHSFNSSIKPLRCEPAICAGSLEFIIGSCNGLVALFSCIDNIILWNPYTRKIRKLPECCFYHLFPVPRMPSYGQGYAYGFGYHPRTDDYKLFLSTKEKAEVYSLRENDWRIIEGSPNYLNAHVGEPGGVLVGNSLHWAVVSSSFGRNIAAFDLGKEKFHLVPLLDCFGATDFVMNVGELGGCLCMAADFFSGRGGGVDIWVMKEYGVVESWIKVFSLAPDMLTKVKESRDDNEYSPDGVIPLAYSQSGAKVLFNIYGQLFWCDMVKKRAELFKHRRISAFKPWILVRSLVSLKIR